MLWEWSIMNCNENKQQVTGACCTAGGPVRSSCAPKGVHWRDVINEMPRRKGSRGKGKEGREES